VVIERPVPGHCGDAAHHEDDVVMKGAGLELCWTEAVVSEEGIGSGSEPGFVRLVHGDDVLWENTYLGGPDAKGYGKSGDAKLLGARAKTIRGRSIVIVRFIEHTNGYSSGMSGVVDIRDVISVVCVIGATAACPFKQQTERDLTVTGDRTTHAREAWTLDIAPDGVLTATNTQHFDDEEARAPVRVPLF